MNSNMQQNNKHNGQYHQNHATCLIEGEMQSTVECLCPKWAIINEIITE